MSERMYDYRVFVRMMQRAVSEAGDTQLSRSWKLVRGCITVHAIVDKEPEQSIEQAMNAAWDDFVAAYYDQECTYVMDALAIGMKDSSPPGLETPIIVAVDEAYKAASQNPKRKRAKRAHKTDSFLTLVQDEHP